MLEGLERVVNDPMNVVFIISGRDQACLDAWLGHIPGLGLSAEHGCFIKHPHQEWREFLSIKDEESSWRPQSIAMFDRYTERTKGSFVEMKKSSVTW
jgi:trehalose-phosphatase